MNPYILHFSAVDAVSSDTRDLPPRGKCDRKLLCVFQNFVTEQGKQVQTTRSKAMVYLSLFFLHFVCSRLLCKVISRQILSVTALIFMTDLSKNVIKQNQIPHNNASVKLQTKPFAKQSLM